VNPNVAMNVLGVLDFIAQINRAVSFEQAQRILEEQKVRVKRAYRQKAKLLHPDLAGDHDRMVELNQAKAVLLDVKIRPPRPQPIIVTFAYNYSTYSANVTSTVNW